MRKLIALCCVAIAFAGSDCFGQSDSGMLAKPNTAGAQELRVEKIGYETIRFYTQNSKPENIESYAFSPNGQYLALSFDTDNLGARAGLSIVDLKKRQLTNTTGSFSFFTMAFDSNSRTVLGYGGYAGLQVYDVATNAIRKIRSPEYVTGKIGIDIEEKNGKLLISRVLREFNPTIGEQIQVGDELLAINEGEKPTRYDDRREWQTLIGKTVKYVLEELAGHPSTWIQLRLSRRGSSEPIDISVQRQWPVGYVHTLPKHAGQLTLARSNGVFLMRSADTLRFSSFVSIRDVEPRGQHAISPDAKRFAMLSYVVGSKKFGLEVFSLETGEIIRSTILNARSFRKVRFSPDSGEVLVGTRDTIEVFDISSDTWLAPVVLTPPAEVDGGRTVTRRIPLGLGFPGDLYTTMNEVVFEKPAALQTFDVSPSGVLAIGSEDGRLVMASLETKGITAEMGERVLGGVPEMVESSPDGKHLVGFAKGMLHIFDVSQNDGSRPADAERLSSVPR